MRTIDGLSGTAVIGTGGNETVQNFGTTVGSIDLGAGTNVFNNESSGLFITGEHVTLGSTSTLINAGTLSSGDWGHVQTTTVDGKMTQTGTPTWLVDLGPDGTSDRLAMTGAAQFGSSATRLDLNPLTMPAGSSSFTLATAASGLGDAAFTFGTYYGDLPIGQTFNTVSSDRDVQLTVTPSVGLFRWTGLTGRSWTTPFVDGVSNWTSDASGQTFVYGTPGVATDVLVGQRSGVSVLAGNFAVNSLHFDNVAPGTGLGDTMIGGGALTIAAKDGKGITIDRGVSSTTLDVDLTLGNSQTWTNDGSLLAIFGGPITGSGRDLTITGVGQTYIDASIDTGGGSLTKDGDGTLVLGGRNGYSGGTFVKNGMIVGSARSLQGAIANDAIVMFDQPDAGEYTGVMSGTGLFVKQGTGALTLSGANTYTGGTYVAAGALQGTTVSLQGNILNLGSLIFDQTGTGTYAGSLAGTGSLLLRGGGSYVFSGNSSTFTGQTTVSGSKLSVNGWLGGGTLFVQSGATVGGVGLIPTVRVQSGGTLAPGNSIGTLSITGSATFETGSHYLVETEAYGSSDQMVVMGSVFGAGGTVDVHAGGTRRYRPINRYTIARFGGSVIPFAGVTSDLAYLVPSLQYEPNRVLLTLRRNDVDFRKAGTQGNETPVADVFNALVATADGAMADSINSVYDLADADIRNAFRTMGGIIYQHVARSGLATTQAFTALAMKRLDLTGSAAAFGGVSADVSRDNLHLAGADASFVRSDDASSNNHGFWLSGLGGVAQYAGSAGSASARTRLLGVAGGLDIEPVHGLTLGVIGGRATPEIHLDGANDRADSRTTQAGGYGRVALGASRVDAAVSFGGSRNQVWRVVTDGTILPTAHASFNGSAMSSQLDYAYGMKLGRSVFFEPQVGYHYGRLSVEGATETGADVLDLLVPDRIVTSNQVTAGARLVKALGGEVTKWTIEGRAAWQRELTPLASMQMRFAGDSTTDGFLLAAPSLRRDGAIVGVSLAGARAKGLRIALDVDGQTGGPISGWSSNISLDKRW
jgi:autotransporter-associated beta strand protein